jgi:hypothetical protein
MLRIMTLSEMLAELRFEARLSADVGHGSHLEARHTALLRRVQEQLYASHDWPNLRVTSDVTVPSGQRYTAYPETVQPDAIREVFARPADLPDPWKELTYGIEPAQLNQTNSDAGETAAQPSRWQPYQPLAAEQADFSMFELWPVPNQSTSIRFRGKRKLGPLVNPDTDRSTLDGMVVVLFAATELLASQKAEDAPIKGQAAQARLGMLLKRAAPGDNRRTSMVPGATRNPRRTQRFNIGE